MYIRPTEVPTVYPANALEGYTDFNLADNAEQHTTDDAGFEYQQVEELTNDVAEPNVATYHDVPWFDRESLDVDPLIEFDKQQVSAK